MLTIILIALGGFILIKLVSFVWKNIGKLISTLFYLGIIALLLYKWIYSPQVVELLSSYAPGKTPIAAAFQFCKEFTTDVTPILGKTVYDMAMHTEPDTSQVDTISFVENKLPNLTTEAKPLNRSSIIK